MLLGGLDEVGGGQGGKRGENSTLTTKTVYKTLGCWNPDSGICLTGKKGHPRSGTAKVRQGALIGDGRKG